jgi:hypothetical protein
MKRRQTMAVKIDMDISKSCYGCKFFNRSYSFVFGTDVDECVIEESLIMFDPKEGRPSWCPLQEIKECE